MDGGVLANNPSEHGLTRIHKFYTDNCKPLNIFSVVSVGTGVFPDRELGNTDLTSLLLGRPLHMVGNVKNMFDLLTHAVSFHFFFSSFFAVTHNFIVLKLCSQLAESESAADNCRSRCTILDVPFYRFSPHLLKVIALGESDNVKLLEMILQARQQAARDPQIGKLVHQWISGN